MGHINVECRPGVPIPAERTQEIPAELLPRGFDDLEWDMQACHCAEAIRKWAHDENKSAAILIIVPGEAEMLKVIAKLSAFFTDHVLDHRSVDSSTPKPDRQKTREELRTQEFRADCNDIIVLATNVFEKGITLCINGLIDTGLLP